MFQNGSPPVSFLNGNMSPSTAPPTPDSALLRKQQEEEHAAAAYAAWEARQAESAQKEAIRGELRKPPPGRDSMPQWWHELPAAAHAAHPDTPFKPASQASPAEQVPATHQADPFGPSPTAKIEVAEHGWQEPEDQWQGHWQREKKKKKWRQDWASQGWIDYSQEQAKADWWQGNGWQEHWQQSPAHSPHRSPHECSQCGHIMAAKHFYCGKCLTHRETGEKVVFPEKGNDRQAASRSNSPARRHIVFDSGDEAEQTNDMVVDEDDDTKFKNTFSWQRFAELNIKQNCVFYRSHVPMYVPVATGLPIAKRLQHCDDYINSHRPIYDNLLIARENLQASLDFIAKQVDKAEHHAQQAVTYKRELEEIIVQEQEALAADEAIRDPSRGAPLPSPSPSPTTTPEAEAKAVSEMLQALLESSSDVATRTLIKKLDAKVRHNSKTQARRAKRTASEAAIEEVGSESELDENYVHPAEAPPAVPAPVVMPDTTMASAGPVRLQPAEPAGAPPGKRLMRKGNSTQPSIPAGEQPLVLGPRIDTPVPESPRGSASPSAGSSSDGIAKTKAKKKADAKRQQRAIVNAAKAQAKEDKKSAVTKASLK